MADSTQVRRRRQRRRRQTIAAVAGGAVLLAGAGTAWAMSGEDGPVYRFASVTRAGVAQTVDADGSLSASDNDAMAFAVGGSVKSVKVAVGDTVTAGQTLATLDTGDLQTAVASARTAFAQAKEQLASDREAQADGTKVTSSGSAHANGSTSTTASNGSTGIASFTSKITTTASTTPSRADTTTNTTTKTAVTAAQTKVIAAEQALDIALAAQDTAVADLVTACAAGDESSPATATVTADSSGNASGKVVSSAAVVTLRSTSGEVATTTSTNPQRVAADGTWTFAGLTSATTYRVEIARSAAIATDGCFAAVSSVTDGQKALDTASSALSAAISALSTTIAGLSDSSSAASGSMGSTGSTAATGTAGSTGSGKAGTTGGTTGSSGSTGSSSNSSDSSGVYVTAERIAADVAGVDAKSAALTVAEQSLTYATLPSTISGTVASVDLAAGDTVSANSTSNTITVVGTGTLSVTVDIGLADIGLVKIGQSASVTVDGRTAPVAGTVSFVGAENSSSGSTPSYPVTITLTEKYASLYDGMGAGVSINVGSAANVLTVPVSALTTTSRGSTVRVRNGSSLTTASVKVGLTGGDRAQIISGLTAGQQVVLANVSAAVPSSDSSSSNGRSGLSGLSGGGEVPGGRSGGGPPGR